MIITVTAISIISFVIIQAPPGDFLDTYVSRLRVENEDIEQSSVEALRVRYGLDKPACVQYLKWMGGVLRGDLGHSLGWNMPVNELIAERLPWSIVIR